MKNKSAIPEPMPEKGKVDILPLVLADIEALDLEDSEKEYLKALVIVDFEARSEAGKRKYGTLLQSGNGRDALMDAYQEAIDLVMYLRQAIEERNDRRK